MVYFRFFSRMGDGPVAFHGKNQGEDDEERTNDDLCVGPPAGGACHDDANLVFHDKGKRADGDEAVSYTHLTLPTKLEV